ncbi:MAG: helix-turn-helix transcriptional regulator [Thermoleophilia bacterium]
MTPQTRELQPALQEKRLAAGLSQQALADLLGVAQQHIARWEGGKVVPNAWMAVRLSEALGTTANEVWPTQPPPRESEHARRRREWDARKRAAA